MGLIAGFGDLFRGNSRHAPESVVYIPQNNIDHDYLTCDPGRPCAGAMKLNSIHFLAVQKVGLKEKGGGIWMLSSMQCFISYC